MPLDAPVSSPLEPQVASDLSTLLPVTQAGPGIQLDSPELVLPVGRVCKETDCKHWGSSFVANLPVRLPGFSPSPVNSQTPDPEGLETPGQMVSLPRVQVQNHSRVCP